jgi:hypothetical protein
VVFRPDGGLVALLDVTTTVAVGGKKGEIAVLRGLTSNGSDDPSFGGAGEVVLNVGEPDTTPTDLLEHRGRLWVSGATYSAADQNAFVARVESDGSGQRSRQFDFRGSYTGSDAILSLAGGMTMLSGPPETLVVVGHGTFTTGTQFAAGAFNGFDGDLAAASYGDVVAGGSNQYSLSSAEPDGPTSVAAIGSFISTSGNIDGSFATTRLLLDADKKCDLAIDVPTPLELTFVGRKGTAAQISVARRSGLRRDRRDTRANVRVGGDRACDRERRGLGLGAQLLHPDPHEHPGADCDDGDHARELQQQHLRREPHVRLLAAH